MTKKIIISLLLFFLFFIFLFGILSNLTIYINIWLIFLPFLILFFDKLIIYIWLFGAGFILDILSPTPFGFYLLILFLTYIILSYLSERVLTQKSLSAFLILNLINLAIFYFINYFVLYFITFKIIFIQTIINLVLAVILFFITNFFTKRLRLETINKLQ